MNDAVIIGLIIGGVFFVLLGLARVGSSSSDSSTSFVPTKPMSNTSLYNRLQLLEAKVDKLYAELNLTPPAPPSPDTDTDIQDFVLKGQKINAIKLYRERYGVGLKEAKDIIDQMAQDLGA